MRIGFFTDTYFPQISGVATSIKTLKDELVKNGNEVFIFTTNDPHQNEYHEDDIIRLTSVPFISMAERRLVIRGVVAATKIARDYKLDIIHTHTEFGMGILGKLVAHELDVPVIHTLHTKYEDYVHYILGGYVIRPGMVKYMFRAYLRGIEGIVCPSKMVYDQVSSYGITKIPRRIIPTGIKVDKYKREDLTPDVLAELRRELGVKEDEKMLLSLSRLAEEKNIQAVLYALPKVIKREKVKFVIVGDGPYAGKLKALVSKLDLDDHVVFTGMIDSLDTPTFYHAADYFVSASTSETQGLTFTESIVCGTPVIAHANPYLDEIIDNPMFGHLFVSDALLADTIIDALENGTPKDPEIWAQKVYDVSAEKFGKSVYEYYVDTIISFEYDNLNREDPIYKKVAQVPLKTAKALAEAPKKAVTLASKANDKVNILNLYGKMKQWNKGKGKN
jgi:1,2-diacylglycerol 3-alpha-glucosyltransferase